MDIAELDGIENIDIIFYFLHLHFISTVLVYEGRRLIFNLNQ